MTMVCYTFPLHLPLLLRIPHLVPRIPFPLPCAYPPPCPLFSSFFSLTLLAGIRVPQVLVTLRDYLYSHAGLQQEGVFRVQGNEKELQQIKNQLNKGTFTESKDVNCVASLIKVYNRKNRERRGETGIENEFVHLLIVTSCGSENSRLLF